jgi:hypothetical protein
MKVAHFVADLLFLATTAAGSTAEVAAQPAPFPVFLRFGFSSVLEFDETPTRVVLGDAQAFQVERLDRSLVLRTMVPYATSNMFVYFKEPAPKLFVLTAAEDANPTYYRKIENPKPTPQTPRSGSPTPVAVSSRSSHVVSARFDPKKDYLTVEILLVADSKAILRPKWELARLRVQARAQSPFKLWSERKEVQKDSAIRARFVFAKPNVARSLVDTTLVLPIEGQAPLILALHGGSR